MVDKKSLRGSYYRLYNDFLGTTDMTVWPSNNAETHKGDAVVYSIPFYSL